MSLPGKPASLWIDTSSAPAFPSLNGDRSVDVAIVGGGITGLTAAALLKRGGKTVAVLEALRVGMGVTGHTTAHLTALLDMRYQDLAARFGEQGARLVAESSVAAIARIAALVAEHQVDCGFQRVPGYLYTEHEQDVETIRKEAEAARKLGLDARLTADLPLPFPVKAALLLPDQAQFHPLAYLYALAGSIPGDGSQIFEQTRVLDVAEGEPCRIQTERGVVTARDVIIATHVPINELLFASLAAPYRSYVLGVRLKGATPSGLFWDTDEPYHYTRNATTPEGELLIVGGADHKTGQEDHTEAHYRQLEAYVRSHFPVDSIAYRWSAQVYEPVDGLPYIGTYPFDSHVYVATGYSGNGMTYGTVAAMILSDKILGRANAWSELYSTTRMKPVAGAKRFVTEGLNVAAHAVGGWLGGADTRALDDVPAGTGRIVEIGGERLAVYRDDRGVLHALSPVCAHAGCIVGWNEVEKSWDCPCHGGRYTATGEVLEGPPSSGLKPKSLP